jgi:hypothetical protein
MIEGFYLAVEVLEEYNRNGINLLNKEVFENLYGKL